MNFKEEYLSDLELEQLILNVEQNELITAPPDLAGQILKHVEMPNRKKEFRRYCLRVATSVAAAIAVAFILPEVVETKQPDDTGILLRISGGTNIFCNDDEINFFK